MCLMALIPIFLISITKFDTSQKEDSTNVLEIFNYELNSKMRFVIGTEISSDGTRFSILKLHVKDDDMTSEDSLEFIISKKKSLGEIGPGNYRIAKDEDGFLNYIDGVFGFLDSKDSGELPFFAHFGEITITEFDNQAVNGFMDIYLKNTIGDTIQIRGDFVALP